MSLAHRAFAYHARVRRRPSSFWFYFCFDSLLKILLHACCFGKLAAISVVHLLAFSPRLSLVFLYTQLNQRLVYSISHAHRAPASRASIIWQPYGNLPPSGSTSVSTPSSSKSPSSNSSNSPFFCAPPHQYFRPLCDAEPSKQQHPQSTFLTDSFPPNIPVQEPCPSRFLFLGTPYSERSLLLANTRLSLAAVELSYACFRKLAVFLNRRARSFKLQLTSRNNSKTPPTLCFDSNAGYDIGW
ncbi:hypothetical protein C8R42DRAFT_728356 [Lentinula raphanica]|nr:hypothetical protein C8R42DRAFT_728356 [Lentinula raphanica]